MKLVLLISQLTSFGHFVYEAAFCCTLWRSSFVGPKGGGEGGRGQEKKNNYNGLFHMQQALPSNLGCCWFDFRWHGRRSEALIRHFSAKRTFTTILDEKGRKKERKEKTKTTHSFTYADDANQWILLLLQLLLLLLWSLSSPKSNKLSFVLMNEVPLQFQEWPT